MFYLKTLVAYNALLWHSLRALGMKWPQASFQGVMAHHRHVLKPLPSMTNDVPPT